jgi:hypothetical protein
LGQARFVHSYTGIVGGPAVWNEQFFWQEDNVWQDAKIQRWLPWRQLIPTTRRYVTRPLTDYSKDVMVQQALDVIEAGGYATVGSHGQMHGLGSHWDVWSAAKVMGPMKALEVASVHGAMFLGLEQDLGSLVPGKLADLMVLEANPLDDIRNTARIRYVMKAGTLHDAATLDELWPRQRPYGDRYWVVPEMYRIDNKPVDVWDVN